jgi:hypothetical protein
MSSHMLQKKIQTINSVPKYVSGLTPYLTKLFAVAIISQVSCTYISAELLLMTAVPLQSAFGITMHIFLAKLNAV